MARHVHADLIHQWAEGAEIEYEEFPNVWISLEGSSPVWYPHIKYRVAQSRQSEPYQQKRARMRNTWPSEYFVIAKSDDDAEDIESNADFVEWVK